MAALSDHDEAISVITMAEMRSTRTRCLATDRIRA